MKKTVLTFTALISLLICGCNLLPTPKKKTSSTLPSSNTTQATTSIPGQSSEDPFDSDDSDESSSDESSSGEDSSSSEDHPIDPTNPYAECEEKHNNKDSSGLLTALRKVTKDGKSGSYGDLWSTYNSCYVRADGKIFDYYSSTTNYVPGGSAQGANYSKEGDSYNREHSIPKSWWGGAESKQGADPYIVVPTDGWVNNKRGNMPFGMVSSATYSSNGGFSKVGSPIPSWGYSGKEVFEPDDSVKGDLARASLYAIAKYENSYSWTSGDGSCFFSGSASTNFGLTNYAIKLLTYWNNLDKPDAWEMSVNDKVSVVQGCRNPFIDHPEYVNTLWKDNSNLTVYVK